MCADSRVCTGLISTVGIADCTAQTTGSAMYGKTAEVRGVFAAVVHLQELGGKAYGATCKWWDTETNLAP